MLDRAYEESERVLEELRQKLKEVEKQRKEAEKQLARTTLPQYLSACHEHMQAKFNVEAFDWSIEDDPYNPRQRKRPNHIRKWRDFDSRQLKIWNELASSNIMAEKHFLSLRVIERWAKNSINVGSEMDLYILHRTTAVSSLRDIIECISSNEAMQRKFGLKG